jgi:hypothetical protein
MALSEMELNFKEFKLRGLCEKHAEATRNLATVSVFA